jgi:hypothetical protein
MTGVGTAHGGVAPSGRLLTYVRVRSLHVLVVALAWTRPDAGFAEMTGAGSHHG